MYYSLYTHFYRFHGASSIGRFLCRMVWSLQDDGSCVRGDDDEYDYDSDDNYGSCFRGDNDDNEIADDSDCTDVCDGHLI